MTVAARSAFAVLSQPRAPRRWVWAGAGLLVLVVAVIGVLVGQVSVPLADVGQVLASHLLGTPCRTWPR